MQTLKYQKLKRGAQGRTPKGSPGYALFATVLFLVVLSVIAAGISRAVLVDAQRNAGDSLALQASLRAKSAIELLVYAFLADSSLAAQNTVQNISIDGDLVIARVSDESGRIDINEADEAVISAAFAGRGLTAAKASELAAAIIDWRDPDDTALTNGAERLEYQALGKSYGPRNAAFETLGELRQVRGMTDNLFACMAPVFTVYGDSLIVNFQVASQDILDIYTWAQTNNWLGLSWTIPPTDPATTGEIVLTRSDGSGAALRLDLTVTRPGLNPTRFGASIRMTRTDYAPYELLSWGRMQGVDPALPCAQ